MNGELAQAVALVAHGNWGLVPNWARTPKAGPINARAETLDEKPSFREAFDRRRCLIPADGIYQWHIDPVTDVKTPYFIHRRDGRSTGSTRPLRRSSTRSQMPHGPRPSPMPDDCSLVGPLSRTLLVSAGLLAALEGQVSGRPADPEPPAGGDPAPRAPHRRSGTRTRRRRSAGSA